MEYLDIDIINFIWYYYYCWIYMFNGYNWINNI